MTRVPTVGLFRDPWHRYTWNDGVNPPIGPLVGVTSVLKLQDVLIGGDLAAWGANIAIRHILSAGADADGAMKAVSAARDIGTAVHAQIESILRGQATSPTVETSPYLYGFTAFLAAERPEFLAVEQMVANLTYGFAGTFDFGARIRRRTALVDVKTGKLKRSHRLQLAAYGAAEFIGQENDPQRYAIPRFRDHYVLLLKPDGSYDLVDMEVTAADRRHFLRLVKAYHRIRAWDDEAKEDAA